MSREFLVRRFMEDTERQSRLASSDEQSESSEQSGSTGKPSPKSGDIPSSYSRQMGPFAPGSPLQYAALAHLAGMNFFQPTASLNPLVYPHLFQSLVGLPNLDRIRRAVQTAAVTPMKPSSPPTDIRMAKEPNQVISEGPKRQGTTPKRKNSAKKVNSAGTPDSNDQISTSTPRKKAVRKLSFDDETASPVSGMFIRDLSETQLDSESPASGEISGDIDESINLVEETEESRKKLAEIPNIIGDYICQLCRLKFVDAFKLAQHRCSRIGHVEYRCPECDKVFNCPANLASHRRWHRPRPDKSVDSDSTPTPTKRQRQNSTTPKKLDFNPVVTTIVEEKVEMTEVSNDEPLNLSVRPEMKDSLLITTKKPLISIDSTTTESAFQCEVCGRQFSRHAYLRRHAVSHTQFALGSGGDDQQEVGCPACDFYFPNKTLADKHYRYSHQREEFGCRFCPLSFHTSPALTRHINKTHPSQECRVILLEELRKANPHKIVCTEMQG